MNRLEKKTSICQTCLEDLRRLGSIPHPLELHSECQVVTSWNRSTKKIDSYERKKTCAEMNHGPHRPIGQFMPILYVLIFF